MKRKLIVMAMTALLTLIPLMDTEQSFDAYAETTKITGTEANASVSESKTSETMPDKAVVTVSKASLRRFAGRFPEEKFIAIPSHSPRRKRIMKPAFAVM